MSAASARGGLAHRVRARRLERELERLRPLGEAYLMRRFSGQLGRADAEDAVAEVMARLCRQIATDAAPANLRAAFLAGARNAAIDLLRARALRPSAPLERALGAPDPAPAPPERAESGENVVRLQEMLARMRSRYGEALMLHYGLGMTVPQIATHLGISKPAAKKLVLRATREAREQMVSIEAGEGCAQMRGLAWRTQLDREASGLAEQAEVEVLRAHFAHCAPCRTFLARLRGSLQELGSLGAFGLGAGEIHRDPGLGERIGQWAAGAAAAFELAAEKARQLALRATGGLSGGEGAAGALLGTGQKVAAICGTATAATATCLLSGAVGPGVIGGGASAEAERLRPAAISAPAPPRAREHDQVPEPAPPATPPETPPPAPERAPAPSTRSSAPQPPPEPPPPEFGIEGSSAAPSPPPPSSAQPEGRAHPQRFSPLPGSGEPRGAGGSPGVGFQG